jgi:eukaryotic-like serine/threonine-protein kinase
MPPGERNVWLADLEPGEPKLAAVLRSLFASQSAAQGVHAEPFLENHDRLAHFLASMVDADPGLIGKQVGPYRVLSLLGHGGMGSVWLAERVDGLFAREVALKLVNPALMNRVLTERLTREREILASLNHPNIARLLDAGFTEDGQPYLALEYVAGTPFTTYCDDHCLSIRERLELFRQVLSAVQYAHARLVIHRDIKPSNILVTEDGQAHLLDFGIAKILIEGEARETELTQLGGRALTPDYAAPEQIAGAPITTAADVYALGVMLYEVLTGERPYRLKRDSRGALEEAILNAEPVPPTRVTLSEAAVQARATTAKKLVRLLRRDLDTIVIKALQKSPTARYATVDAFGEDIARFLRGDVVLAQRDSVVYRALKFARRHRVAIAVVSVLILTLAGGLAATTYEARVASARGNAELQANLRLLTQAAATRLRDADVSGALGIILEVLPHRGAKRSYTPEALSVFQAARAADAQVFAISDHTDTVRSIAFSTDGQRLVTASFDRTARIWDAATGREITLLTGHTDRVNSAAFSPDGRRVVTTSADKTARIWDATTGRAITVLSGHTDRVTSAAFSPDGRIVVTASFDTTARLWDTTTGRQIAVLRGHAGRVNTAAFSPDSRRIVTASDDRTVRMWDAATTRQTALLSGHTDLVRSAAFAPDGRRVLTASGDRTARIWDSATGREIMLLSGHGDQVEAAAFSPDGRRVVTASDDKTVRIWDAATGREIMLLSGHSDWVASAAFSPDGRRIATASYDKTARTWDTAAGHQIMLLSGHTQPVESAAFSPDGRRIVTASDDKTARIWDAAAGRETTLLSGHSDWVETAAFSPDGRRVVTASNDNTARIWDAATGWEIMLLSGHKDHLTSAAFSPDGERIVTASNDNTARIWESYAPALDIQIGWADAARFDALSSTERFQLGLPSPSGVRQWPLDKTKCDESAAAPYDPDRRASGVMLDQIVADIAVGACTNVEGKPDDRARSSYQHGRTLMASSDFAAARRDFEDALAGRYRSARIDLGMMLSQPAAGMLDVPRAISLYEQAWHDGVTIAAFELGNLYEHGVSRAGGKSEYSLATDDARAWSWYQKAADAGQPAALARFAERAEAAASSAESAAKKNAYWLEAFRFYAAAAERARGEDWPSDAWRNWRYRQASLARLLAREGMMQDVAEAYRGVRDRYAPPPGLWERLVSFVGMDY